VDWIWSAIGGAIAMTLALLLVGGRDSPFLLFSLGGSTVFLFVLTETEAAQPRALPGGHIGGVLIGILCYHRFRGHFILPVHPVHLMIK
jgi:CBS-domain-containing membrane protein